MKFLTQREVWKSLGEGGSRSSAHTLENARKIFGDNLYPFNERIGTKSIGKDIWIVMGQNWHEAKTANEKKRHVFEIFPKKIEGNIMEVLMPEQFESVSSQYPGLPVDFCLKYGQYTTCRDGEPVFVFAEGGTGYYDKPVTKKKISKAKKETAKKKTTKGTKKVTKKKSAPKKKKTTSKKKKSTPKKKKTSKGKKKKTTSKKKTSKGKKKTTKGKKKTIKGKKKATKH
jgi:hypothetical protein